MSEGKRVKKKLAQGSWLSPGDVREQMDDSSE